MKEAPDRVYSWKQEHPEEYSRFSVELIKMEHNDFSCLERIFNFGRHMYLLNAVNCLHRPHNSTIWNTNTTQSTSRWHSSVLAILIQILPLLCFSLPSATSPGRNTSIIQPRELILSFCTRRNNSTPPRVQSGNVEEGLYRI